MMTDQLEFFPVTNDKDIQQVVELAERIWREHFIPIVGADLIEYMLIHVQGARAIQHQIDQGACYEIVRTSHQPIGYLAYESQGNRFKISKLYLLPEYRGRGWGRTMLQHLEHIARDHGSALMWLTTNRKNQAAINIYKHWGFTQARELDTDIGKGFVLNDYVFEKTLD